MDVLVAIDTLDDLVHNAPSYLLTDKVVVHPEKLSAAVDRVRRTLDIESPRVAAAVARRLDELERVARDAEPVALISRVRVPRETLYAVLDSLRAEVPEAIWRERHGHA